MKHSSHAASPGERKQKDASKAVASPSKKQRKSDQLSGKDPAKSGNPAAWEADHPNGIVLWGCFVFVASALIYGMTLHPSVAGGDSGELACAAHELAVPHPPGYPTFALATKLAEVILRTLFPSMSILFAHNCLHALLSTLAVTSLYFAAALLAKDIASGIVAAFCFGFGPNVWSYAVSTEVFPLNNFFMCTLVLLAIVYAQRVASKRPSQTLLFFSSAWCGISLTNQHTSILFVAPVVLWVLLIDPNITRRPLRTFAWCCLCFLLGLLPYLYLPISSYFVLSSNGWGESHTWGGFWTHVLRREYGTLSLASKEADYRSSDAVRTWILYFKDIADQTSGILWALAIPAVLSCLWKALSFFLRLIPSSARRPPSVGGLVGREEGSNSRVPSLLVDPVLLLFILWAFYNAVFNYLCNLPIEQPLFYAVQQRFWMQPLILVCLFMGLGFCILVRRWSSASFLPRIALAILIAAVQVGGHFSTQDESQNYYIRDFGRAILDPLPNGSILLTKGDLMINSARSVQVAENFRRDVIILDQELLTFEWYNKNVKKMFPELKFPGAYYHPTQRFGYDMRTFLKGNRQSSKRRVFLAYGYKEGDYSVEGTYTALPFGISSEAMEIPEANSLHAKKAEASKIVQAAQEKYINELLHCLPHDLNEYRLPPRGRYPGGAWESVAAGDFQQAAVRTAFELLSLGELEGDVEPIPPGAEKEAESDNVYYRALKGALKFSLLATSNQFPVEKTPEYVWRNLGIVAQNLLKYEPSNRTYSTLVHESFATYLSEVGRRGLKLSQQDRTAIQAIIDFYRGKQ